jgi:hypothetical protein
MFIVGGLAGILASGEIYNSWSNIEISGYFGLGGDWLASSVMVP